MGGQTVSHGDNVRIVPGGSVVTGEANFTFGFISLFRLARETRAMTYRTTVGWSLITSGIVTLILEFVLPYPSYWWGILLLIVGILVFATRQIL